MSHVDAGLTGSLNVKADVSRLVRPRSIAVLGASSDPTKLGGRVLANLRRGNPTAEVVPVNRNGIEGGVRSLADLDEKVDVVVAAVPRDVVSAELATIEECAGGLIVFASGYGEVGEHAHQQVLHDLHRRGVGVLGPNTVGLVSGETRASMTFSVAVERSTVALDPRGLAIVTQSGAMGARLFAGAASRGLPVSSFVGTGNEAGFTVADFIADVAVRNRAAGVLLHLENMRNWDAIRASLEVCRDSGTQVAILVGGRTEQGQLAAASHTGALMASGALLAQEVLTEMGHTVATSDGELLDYGAVLASRRRMSGRRLGAVSISGGAAVLLADQAADAGFELAQFAPGTTERLRELLPEFVEVNNPVDLTAAFLEDDMLMQRVLDTVAADDGVDGVVMYGDPGLVRAAAPDSGKALVGCMTNHQPTAGAQGPVPHFNDIRRAVRALRAVVPPPAVHRDEEPGDAEEISSPVPLSDAMAWVDRVGIPAPRWEACDTLASVATSAERLWAGRGVVLKGNVDSSVHKAANGALRLVRDRSALMSAAGDLLSRHDAVVVQELAPSIVFEFICGVEVLEPFGPRLVIGWGGSWAEEIARTVSRQLPLSREQIRACVDEVGIGAALTKKFGPDSSTVQDLVDLIHAFSSHGGLVNREINPVAVLDDGGLSALDIRFS